MSSRVALRPVRLAVVGLFFLTGLALAMWVVNIPAVQAKTGVSHATLGGLLLLLGFGSLIGMQVTGPLVDRLGSRVCVIMGGALLVVGVNLPGFATSAWQVGVALFVLGLGNGVMDVAMNDQAVLVEQRWGRPIMSSFHAFFSVGGAVGAVIAAGVQTAGLSMHWSMGIGAVVAAVLTAVAVPLLITEHHASSSQPADVDIPAGLPAAPPRLGRRIVALASLAFLFMLAEGTANDWSALQAVEHLQVPESAASLAYGAFAIAMTIGRFAADPISHRFGAVHVVRYGSIVSAVGMAIIVTSTLYPLTLVGWAVFGIGLSGIVPQIFTAAGNLPVKNRGVIISRVVGAGYIGLLAGPAIIGWLAHPFTLTHALALPLLFCLVGIILAGQVAPSPASKPGESRDARSAAS